MRMKGDVAVEICALLAFSAIKNNDKVGLILFSDRIEKFVPPRKGRRHVLRVLRELLYHRPDRSGTDIRMALEYLARVTRRRAVVFLVSDFLGHGFGRALTIAGRRHDTIAVRVRDRREAELPAIGLVEFEDAETGERFVVNTSDRSFRETFGRDRAAAEEELERTLRHGKVDLIDVRVDRPYVKPLMRFFKERERRRR